jgi:hypothetical protein
MGFMEDTELLQAVLGAILRKYVPNNKKIELDLMRSYKDIDLDITVNDFGIAKIKWSDVNAAF